MRSVQSYTDAREPRARREPHLTITTQQTSLGETVGKLKITRREIADRLHPYQLQQRHFVISELRTTIDVHHTLPAFIQSRSQHLSGETPRGVLQSGRRTECNRPDWERDGRPNALSPDVTVIIYT